MWEKRHDVGEGGSCTEKEDVGGPTEYKKSRVESVTEEILRKGGEAGHSPQGEDGEGK